MHHYLKGNIVKIIDETPRVKRFFWKSMDKFNWDLAFIPGQFVIVHFPEIKEALPYRSYSIASLEDDIIELCVSFKKGGQGTASLWQLKVGDELEITPPKGEFVLRENLEEEICFIATGTGIAPLRPMLIFLLKNGFSGKIFLIYGNRNENDILYNTEFVNLTEKYPNFEFMPVLSQSNWNGHKGYVHPYYQDIFKDGRAAQFYICGWSEMIRETRHNLKALGYTRKQYFIESYD